jgi:hypothetical protein
MWLLDSGTIVSIENLRIASRSDSGYESGAARAMMSLQPSIDREFLCVTLTLKQTGICDVGDIGSELSSDDGDWMSALLRFRRLRQAQPRRTLSGFALTGPTDKTI